MGRKKYSWKIDLVSDKGELVEWTVSNYWSPTQEGIETAIGISAAAEAYMASGKRFKFAPAGVTRL